LVEWIQPLQQQVHDILQQANASTTGQLLQQGKQLTKVQIQQKLPHLPWELDAMGTIAS
jgi:hypothetical protein